MILLPLHSTVTHTGIKLFQLVRTHYGGAVLMGLAGDDDGCCALVRSWFGHEKHPCLPFRTFSWLV